MWLLESEEGCSSLLSTLLGVLVPVWCNGYFCVERLSLCVIASVTSRVLIRSSMRITSVLCTGVSWVVYAFPDK